MLAIHIYILGLIIGACEIQIHKESSRKDVFSRCLPQSHALLLVCELRNLNSFVRSCGSKTDPNAKFNQMLGSNANPAVMLC